MTQPFLPPSSRGVHEALRGFAHVHQRQIRLMTEPTYLVAVDRAPGRRVGLVSGGGSGHEPLHIGFVGRGMLDAAVPGQVFASPHNRQIYQASRAVAGDLGVLHIVKNYTGDRINFGIAAERLAAGGVRTARVLVDDDIATDDSLGTGRRGMGATVVVEKMLGAAADAGANLEELAELGARIAAASRSIAVARRAHTMIDTGQPAFVLEPGTLEFGVGIHGERSASSAPWQEPAELVATMVDAIISRGFTLSPRTLLLVNGLGSTSGLELHACYAAAVADLGRRGIEVAAGLVGTYVPALDMAGVSITVVNLDEQMLELWTAPCDVPCFPSRLELLGRDLPAATDEAPANDTSQEAPAASGFLSVANRLASDYRASLGDLDQATGDGDFGDNLANGVVDALARSRRGMSLGEELDVAAGVFLDGVGGTSGPLIGLLLQHLARAADGAVESAGVGRALTQAGEAISRVGGAKEGDCTLLDAVGPAGRAGSSLAAIVDAAIRGTERTRQMQAAMGRASYLGARSVGFPDPGAAGVALLLTALAEAAEPGAGTDGVERLERLMRFE